MIKFLLGSSYNKVINSQSQFDALTIAENDRIKLNGDFYGSLTIDQNNVSINGGGIVGAQEITGWSSEGGGIYSKIFADIKWFYIVGEDVKQAQSSAIAITGVPADNQIQIASGDIAGVNVVGAKLVYLPNDFSYSTEFIINTESSGLLTLDKDHTNSSEIYFPDVADNLYIFNIQDYLTDNFDWCYQGGTLYVKLPTSPTNYDIQGVLQDVGIEIAGNNCKINNVNIYRYYKAGIRAQGDNGGFNVTNNTIRAIKEDAIQITGISDNNKINYNTIYECGTGGIRQAIGSNAAIRYNTIYSIGSQNTLGSFSEYVTASRQISGVGILCASHSENNITTIAKNNLIEYNTIYNCAYNGISSHKGQNTIIRNNNIYNTHKTLRDGGGIYIFFYRPDYPELATGIEVYNNIIHDCLNGRGIYFDNRTSGAECYNNTVYNTIEEGILPNTDTNNINIHDNTIFKCEVGIFYNGFVRVDAELNDDGHIFEDNIIIQGLSTKYCFLSTDSIQPFTNGGNSDRNYYINPYTANIASIDGAPSNFAALQAEFSEDVNSIDLSDYITAPGDPDNEILLIPNPSDNVLNGSAPEGTWKDIDGTITTNYSLTAWSSLVLLKDLP